MKITTNLLIILVISGILANFGLMVYATTYSLTIVRTKVNTVTNNVCDGITILPTTGTVFMACGTSGGTSWTIRAINGATETANSAVTIVASSEVRQKFFAVSTNIGVFSTGTLTSGTAMFREYTLSGTTLTNTRTFNAPCTVSTQGAFNTIGTSVWFSCSDGTVREFGLDTFTQLNSYSGLTTGTPTCTTPRQIAMASTTVGFAVCDTNTAILFHLSGSSVVKDDSITLSNTYSNSNEGYRWFYSSDYVYFYSHSALNTPEAINVDLAAHNIVSTAPIALPIGTGNDAVVASGGYYLFSGYNDDVIYLLNSNTAPPNNFVTTFTLSGNTFGGEANIASNNGNTFILSKGQNGNSTIFYFTLSNLLVDGSSPNTPNQGTGGIDCDLPENANILICRLGSSGTAGNAGAFVIGNTTNGTGLLGLGCSVGLVDCRTDDNPQTNGLGLLIFVASLFVVVGMFYSGIGARATWQLPVYFWAMIIIALSAFFTITGLINPVFLILSIIAIIALAVPKIQGIFGGRGIDSGGSTL